VVLSLVAEIRTRAKPPVQFLGASSIFLVRLQQSHDAGKADADVSRDLCRRLERVHGRLPTYAKE